jgi:Protein of unknown function (DUF2569)
MLMPFVLMAIVSGAVAVWLSGFPLPRASVPHGDAPILMRPGLAGIRGWLFCYVIILGLQALHSFGLTIAALIIKVHPSLVGLNSFVSLPSLGFYELGNLILVLYTVALYVLMVRRKKSAIVHNVVCNVLAVVFLVCWHLLGMKSTLGTALDSLPSIAGVCYVLASRRVRSTFVAT